MCSMKCACYYNFTQLISSESQHRYSYDFHYSYSTIYDVSQKYDIAADDVKITLFLHSTAATAFNGETTTYYHRCRVFKVSSSAWFRAHFFGLGIGHMKYWPRSHTFDLVVSNQLLIL